MTCYDDNSDFFISRTNNQHFIKHGRRMIDHMKIIGYCGRLVGSTISTSWWMQRQLVTLWCQRVGRHGESPCLIMKSQDIYKLTIYHGELWKKQRANDSKWRMTGMFGIEPHRIPNLQACFVASSCCFVQETEDDCLTVSQVVVTDMLSTDG